MFAVEDSGTVIDCRLMQGVSVVARFRQCKNLIGLDLHYLDSYHPTVRSYNKLVQAAIMNARELFLRIEADNYEEEKVLSPLGHVGASAKGLFGRVFKKSNKRDV